MCVPFLHTIIGSKGDSHCQRDCHSLEYGHVTNSNGLFFSSPAKSLLSCTFDIEFGAAASFIYYHLCNYRPRADAISRFFYGVNATHNEMLNITFGSIKAYSFNLRVKTAFDERETLW